MWVQRQSHDFGMRASKQLLVGKPRRERSHGRDLSSGPVSDQEVLT